MAIREIHIETTFISNRIATTKKSQNNKFWPDCEKPLWETLVLAKGSSLMSLPAAFLSDPAAMLSQVEEVPRPSHEDQEVHIKAHL